MTELSFAPADIPTDTPPPPPDDTADDAPSSDLTCEVCGTSLSYGGRGRKPTRCDEHKRSRSGTSSTVRGSAGAVNSALAQMDVLYSLVTGGLMMVNPAIAADLASRVETAQRVNRAAFEADPKLAKRVAGNASGMAPVMFIGAQVYLIGPTLRVAYDVSRQRRADDAAATDNGAVPFQQFTDDDMPHAG